MNQDFSPRAGPPAVLQTPFQAPAVDRSLTAPARADTDAPGAEANWDFGLDRFGRRPTGIVPWAGDLQF
ncbi:hypothetical protein [Streptomyces sp. NPDC051704]|uniref:hypothetical protein n=1 Tax=Streptomyces sp. NPDC051704 TaxID=3365671 RepID=UPI0037934A63